MSSYNTAYNTAAETPYFSSNWLYILPPGRQGHTIISRHWLLSKPASHKAYLLPTRRVPSVPTKCPAVVSAGFKRR